MDATCHGLSMETLQASQKVEISRRSFEEVGDYQGPRALLVDVANSSQRKLHPPKESGRKEWRKAFKPVLDVAGWREPGGLMGLGTMNQYTTGSARCTTLYVLQI